MLRDLKSVLSGLHGFPSGAARKLIDAFTNWAKADLEAQDVAMKVTAPLYRYMTMGALVPSLTARHPPPSEQGMWFTDYRHFRDPTEVKYGTSILISEITAMAAESPEGMAFCPPLAAVMETLWPNFDVFICCFTPNRDRVLHWQVYGEDGKGASIGFKPAFFHPSPHVGPITIEQYSVGQVCYSEAESRARVRYLISEALRTVRKLRSVCPNELMFKNACADVAREISFNLINLCVLTKRDDYAHECEVRLVIFRLKGQLAEHIKVRPGTSISYIDVPMPLSQPECLHEVIIGPSVSSSAYKEIAEQLERLVPHISVVKSLAPLT